MIAHAQCIGDDGERRVDRTDRDEKAGVDNVEIVQVVRFAVEVKGGTLGIATKSYCPGLMGGAAYWYPFAQVK